MAEPLFLKPVFQDKIWGGTKLHTKFGYELPTDTIGEDWAISAHPHGMGIIENGDFAGSTLADLWTNHQELFGHQKGAVFPLLTKILDAQNNLSVQVHPDDEYGKTHAGELGKTECWYVIDADPGSEIVYGHTAKTHDEFVKMVKEGKWDKLLTRVPVKKGDFFYVPSGMIHGIGKGILILETQQSSDTTYRVYDYDRRDDQGNLRELHIQQSIDVTTVPAEKPKLAIETKNIADSSVTTYVKTDFFNVYGWQIKGDLTFKKTAPYTLFTVIEGHGKLLVDGKKYDLQKGTSGILPHDVEDWTIYGDLFIIASEPGKDA